MKGFILLVIGIITMLIIVGGVVGYSLLSNIDVVDDSSSVLNDVKDVVKDEVNNVSSTLNTKTNDSTNDGGVNIVKEFVKFNEQNGEGYYRQVEYSDGNFRQYDVETGKLIGSSYESDQDKLPSVE